MIKDSLKIKGKFEIINNETGEVFLSAENLVLLLTRAAILQVMFNDDKVMTSVKASTSSIIPTNGEYNNKNYSQFDGYRRLICGFCFGNNGNEINTNPVIVRVPSPQDIAMIGQPVNDFFDQFYAVPMITLSGLGTSDLKIYNTSGSYENLSEITNGRQYNYDSNGYLRETLVDGRSVIKYFNLNCVGEEVSNTLYCKTFDTMYSTTTIDPASSEIDYKIKLDVENFNIVGETINELGLIMADCKVEGGVITEIKKNSGVLATRVTFTPITLSTQLLTQFSMYYHIYI